MEEIYTESDALQLSPRLPAANVGGTERLLTLVAGGALLGYAWRHRSTALGLTSAGLLARGATGYCPGYAALGVNHAEARQALSGSRGVHVRESITINASPERVYRFWLAHDAQMIRDVALKELRPEQADDAVISARFLREAQIT